MTNKQKVQKMITEVSKESGNNYTLEGYDATLNYFSDYQLSVIKEALSQGTNTDLRFTIKNVTIILRITFTGYEIDFYAMDLAEYKEEYEGIFDN